MINQNEFQYLEAKEFLHLPVIELKDVKSFTRFANANDIQYIFRITNGDSFEFFFTNNNIVYKLHGGGFRTLGDMNLAQNGNFPDAKEYYAGKEAGFTEYNHYNTSLQTGSYSKAEYDAADKAGFAKGFEKFRQKYDEYKKGAHTAVIGSDMDNPVKLHKYALDKEIKTFDEFEKIYNAGFPDLLSYTDASAKGFNEGTKYYDALKRGFSESKEYEEALKLQIENKKEYDEYRYLKDLNSGRDYPFDQLQLLIALSNSDNGAIIPITKAKELLQAAQDKLRKPAKSGAEGQKVMPIWYTSSIGQENKLIEFLKSNKDLKKFGFYNNAKKAFEIFKPSAVKILVDGSNVAHNGKKNPDLQNIHAVIKELKFYKFKNIIVIVDASLRHKIKYPAQLDELINDLKKDTEVHQSPSQTAADEYLIAMAKKEKCLIVTNDEFRDWKKGDKWVRDKVDDLLIKFRVVSNDNVILTGLDQHIEHPVEA